MGGDDIGQPHAVGGVGARHGDEVLHGGVCDEATVLHVLLDRLRQRAHETQTSRHPADAAIKAAREGLERKAVLLMQ